MPVLEADFLWPNPSSANDDGNNEKYGDADDFDTTTERLMD